MKWLNLWTSPRQDAAPTLSPQQIAASHNSVILYWILSGGCGGGGGGGWKGPCMLAGIIPNLIK